MTKARDPWAVVTMEDLEGAIEVMFFPSIYQSTSHLLVPDAIILVNGRSSVATEQCRAPRDRCQRARSVPTTVGAGDDHAGCHSLHGPAGGAAEGCARHLPRDDAEVRLRLQAQSSTKVMRLDDRLRVSPSAALMADLKALLGPSCLAP